jgi:hypothetical protein
LLLGSDFLAGLDLSTTMQHRVREMSQQLYESPGFIIGASSAKKNKKNKNKKRTLSFPMEKNECTREGGKKEMNGGAFISPDEKSLVLIVRALAINIPNSFFCVRYLLK